MSDLQNIRMTTMQNKVQEQIESIVKPRNIKQLQAQNMIANMQASGIIADLKDDNEINGSPELKEQGDVFKAFVEQTNALGNKKSSEGVSETLMKTREQVDSFNSMVESRQEVFGDVLDKQKETRSAWAEAKIPEGDYKPAMFTDRATQDIKNMKPEELASKIITDTDTETKISSGLTVDNFEMLSESRELMKSAYGN